MNGVDVESLVEPEPEFTPDDLDIDPRAKKIFWSHPKNNSIEFADLETGHGRTSLQLRSNLSKIELDLPRAVAVDREAGSFI